MQILDAINMEVSGGNGILKIIEGISMTDLTEADGDTLDNGSTPPMAALETNGLGIVVAAGQALVGCLNFILPRDYDEDNDKLRIRVLVVSSGTDVPTLTATAYAKRASTALGSDLAPDATAAIPVSTAYADWRVLNLDGNGLKGGDVIHATISAGTHATHTVDVSALEVQYKGDIVYYDKDDRE